jgi:putative ABC transport system permease protein
MRVYWKEAWRSLYANKQRTILALIGIVIGLGSVIALVSIGKIVTNEATKQFLAMGTDMISVRLNDNSPTSNVLRDVEFLETIQQHVSCLRLAAPFTRISDNIENDQGGSSQLDIFGATQHFLTVGKLTLSAGRFISSLDAHKKYIVLGANVPKILGLRSSIDNMIGQNVEIKQEVFTVVGVLNASPSIVQINADVNHSVFMPIVSALDMDAESKARRVVARMVPQADSARCSNNFQQYFLLRQPSLDAEVTTAEQLIKQMRKQTEMFSIMLAAIGSISLVVGGVGIMNIMLVSVSERRQEIGIRRALGAKQNDIRYQFLVEAVLLSIIGGALGIMVGVGAAYIVSDIQGWEFFVTNSTIFLGAGVSAAIGIFFGFFPAHQAAKLDPITALRGD